MKGKGPRMGTVIWLAQHPGLFDLADEQLAKRMIRLGFYSRKTYWRDIRVQRLRAAATAMLSDRAMDHITRPIRSERIG